MMRTPVRGLFPRRLLPRNRSATRSAGRTASCPESSVRCLARAAFVLLVAVGSCSAPVLAASKTISEACAAGASDQFPANAVPGIDAFERAIDAWHHHRVHEAIHSFKLAAFWGEKVAEYDLGLMYWQGKAIPQNRPLAVAWLALADQRHNSDRINGSLQYAYARLDGSQRHKAAADFGQLAGTYGDGAALTRARDAWRRVARSSTGSRLGASDELSGGSGVRERYLSCNRYWPYPIRENLAGKPAPHARGS